MQRLADVVRDRHPAAVCAVIDSMGRVIVPRSMRDELCPVPGTEIDVSRFGNGVHVAPGGRTAGLRSLSTG